MVPEPGTQRRESMVIVLVAFGALVAPFAVTVGCLFYGFYRVAHLSPELKAPALAESIQWAMLGGAGTLVLSVSLGGVWLALRLRARRDQMTITS